MKIQHGYTCTWWLFSVNMFVRVSIAGANIVWTWCQVGYHLASIVAIAIERESPHPLVVKV